MQSLFTNAEAIRRARSAFEILSKAGIRKNVAVAMLVMRNNLTYDQARDRIASLETATGRMLTE
jgi:hypothetical protein